MRKKNYYEMRRQEAFAKWKKNIMQNETARGICHGDKNIGHRKKNIEKKELESAEI